MKRILTFDFLLQVKGNKKVESKDSDEQYDALSKYGTDLLKMAAEGELFASKFDLVKRDWLLLLLRCPLIRPPFPLPGKFDPVIGRDDEIRRAIQVGSSCALWLLLGLPLGLLILLIPLILFICYPPVWLT